MEILVARMGVVGSGFAEGAIPAGEYNLPVRVEFAGDVVAMSVVVSDGRHRVTAQIDEAMAKRFAGMYPALGGRGPRMPLAEDVISWFEVLELSFSATPNADAAVPSIG